MQNQPAPPYSPQKAPSMQHLQTLPSTQHLQILPIPSQQPQPSYAPPAGHPPPQGYAPPSHPPPQQGYAPPPQQYAPPPQQYAPPPQQYAPPPHQHPHPQNAYPGTYAQPSYPAQQPVYVQAGAAPHVIVVDALAQCPLGGGHIWRDNYITVTAIILAIVFILYFLQFLVFLLLQTEDLCEVWV
ncbi:hypothetical protein BC829DRAFT_443769 [Chytridium lagenaria]|nr:hypothetical protein BC829DRAFT_443769 [Chytridium lagenaria]